MSGKLSKKIKLSAPSQNKNPVENRGENPWSDMGTPSHPIPPAEVWYLDPQNIPIKHILRRYDWMSRVSRAK